MKVLFVHPDLGVGGAERLVIDMAIGLLNLNKNHEITILTNHYDAKRCFEDTRQLNIVTAFQWMPRHLFGRLHAFLAYLKILLASLWFIYFDNREQFDAVICDQISLPVAVFKWPVLFYCHYPDQLLAIVDKRNWLKKFYRMPLNWLEMRTTLMADVILVNSNFTKQVMLNTFKQESTTNIDILYPSLNTEVFDSLLEENSVLMNKWERKKFKFLSINRFERKKGLHLAIEAMHLLKSQLSDEQWNETHLVLAGGYDQRVAENVQHFAELKELCASLDLDENVSFMRSVSDVEKRHLLRNAYALLYTPVNEHFGIVPLEAMYCEVPVLATNSGGK